MSEAHDDLRAYYEREASLGLRRGQTLRAGRLDLRERFIERLRTEDRRTVLDLGSGPGRDAEGFLAAGLDAVGLDLAVGNAHLAAGDGITVVPGSVLALPFRPGAFDAAWSLSVLMHLAERDAAAAIDELMAAVRPGAPVLVAVWGLESPTTLVNQSEIVGRPRPFHLRSVEENRQLFERGATVEDVERWENASDGWDYQAFHLRRGG